MGIASWLLYLAYYQGKCNGYVKGHLDGTNGRYDPPTDDSGYPLGDSNNQWPI